MSSLKNPISVAPKTIRFVHHLRHLRARRRYQAIATLLECGLTTDSLLDHPHTLAPEQYTKLRSAVYGTLDQPLSKDAGPPNLIKRISVLSELCREEPAVPHTFDPPERVKVAMLVHRHEGQIVNGYTLRSRWIIRELHSLGIDVMPISVSESNEAVSCEIDGLVYQEVPAPLERSDLEGRSTELADSFEGLVRRGGATVVHAVSNHVIGHAGRLVAKRLRLPFVYELRGLWEETRSSVVPTYKSSLGYRVQRSREVTAAHAAHQILVNGETLGTVLKKEGVKSSKIKNLPNGAPPLSLPISVAERRALLLELGLGEGPVVGFVGSITDYEGLETVVEAVRRTPPCQLLIVGGGSYLANVRDLASDLGLRFRSLGPVPSERAQQIIRVFDIAPIVRPDLPVTTLVPPLKPLEILASHAVLVVSDLPPLRPFAAEGRGFVVPPSDPDALARVFRLILSDEGLRRETNKRARKWAATEGTWKVRAREVQAVYDSFIFKNRDTDILQ